MHSHRGPSGATYHLDAEGSVDCDVSFTIHTNTESEDDVMISMEDILFLAALHVRSVRSVELENATDLQVLGLEER